MPSDQAMRAAWAWLDPKPRATKGTRKFSALVARLADLIDRETGLPELMEQRSLMCVETGDLRRRLAAVEALHAQAGHYCAYCGNSWPCLTICAARGEYE